MREAVKEKPLLTRRSTVLALTALLLAGTQFSVPAQAGPDSLEWTTISPEGEEFTVRLPKESTAETGEQTYHKMVLKTRLYLSAANPGPVLAVASISGIKSNPALYSEFERLNSYVDAFKSWFPEKVRSKGAVVKLTLVGEKTLNRNLGREYSLTIADLTGTAQVYATKKRFYAVVVLDTKKDEGLKDRFLSSFLLPEKVAEPPAAVAQQQPSEAPPATAPQVNKPQTEGEKTNPAVEPANNEPKPAEGTAKAAEVRTVNGGVLNGRALFLPKPEYPPEAHNAKATGTVVVQITIDEQGGVISAKAVSGHPLLQQVCVNAALQARFSPTMLTGEPVKVTGVLTYNFVR